MQDEYAERLEWLRARFADFREPRCVAEDAPTAFTDIQVARRRFAIACVALNVPDAQITAALPGFDPDIPGLRPYWTPKPFAPEPYFVDADAAEYVKSQLQRCRGYLRDQVEQARRRFVQLKLSHPTAHRTKQLDLAARYFITVRHKILSHAYADIALDHVKPRPRSEKQMRRAENLLKQAVRAVVSEVRLEESLSSRG